MVAPSTAGASSDGAACPGVVVLAVEACGVAVLVVEVCGVAVLGVDACPGGDPSGGGLVMSPAALAWWWAQRRWLSAFFCFLNVCRACELGARQIRPNLLP
jgi:hypothetical protein